MLFYATFNQYGSETSVGFDNTVQVFVFYSRTERDRFVQDTGNKNLSICAISRDQARRLVKPNQNGKRAFELAGGKGFIFR